MTGSSTELAAFLDTIPKLLGPYFDGAADGGAVGAELKNALSTSGLLDLGLETSDLPDAREWLAATVERVARTSPSLAFSLASRYTAQRALNGDGGDASHEDSTTAILPHAHHGTEAATVVVPTQFDPDEVVLLDVELRTASVMPAAPWSSDDGDVRRTGLRESALRSSAPTDDGSSLSAATAAGAVHDWFLLNASVGLGTAGAALSAAETYAVERRQFGDSISTFAGLRAILVAMELRVAEVRALVERAQSDHAGPEAALEAFAAAGPAAVDVAIDAIQVHGGYGYIDEYPVAGLLRDAVSLRARGGGHRALVAHLAADRLGPAGQGARA